MNLSQKIVTARIKKGLTQEQLADLCGVTARTIQRIETGATTPRSFTLKAIASTLEMPFEELSSVTPVADSTAPTDNNVDAFQEDNERHFLKLLCLSCFSYLLIPYIHFLIPAYLLKKEQVKNPLVLHYARQIIQRQIYWVVASVLTFLTALGYNLVIARQLNNGFYISYVVVFFLVYFANAIIIGLSYRNAYLIPLSSRKPS